MDLLLNTAMTICSLVIGGIIGYFIAYYFHKKQEPYSKHILNVAFDIEEIYIKTKYPNIFRLDSFSIEYSAPQNKDIPYIRFLRCEKNTIYPGETIFILFRMVDNGMNFSMDGITARNSLNNLAIPITDEAFAWYSLKFKIPENIQEGNYKILFELEDNIKNKNKQTFIYTILEKNKNKRLKN